jgi:hypothetical protein
MNLYTRSLFEAQPAGHGSPIRMAAIR